MVWNRMWCGERGEGRGSNWGPCHQRGGGGAVGGVGGRKVEGEELEEVSGCQCCGDPDPGSGIRCLFDPWIWDPE